MSGDTLVSHRNSSLSNTVERTNRKDIGRHKLGRTRQCPLELETAMQHQSLSVRDAGVLNILFDPEAQPTPEICSRSEPSRVATEITLTDEQTSLLRNAERQAIKLAEEGDLSAADDLLSRTIAEFPSERPSLWSNRAQVRRLSRNLIGAMDDLSQAIRIATPAKFMAASTENANVLASAHAHRATIYMLIARHEITGVLEDENKERLEEWASRDFAMAGKYGSQLARAMSVRTNPYAKLCGAIVQTAMQAELQPIVQ